MPWFLLAMLLPVLGFTQANMGQPAEPSVLGAAKSISSVESNFDGSFVVVYEITAANLGTSEITSVNLSDDLSAAFPSPAEFEVLDLSSETATVREDYDGRNAREILDGQDSLAPGESISVTLTVQVTPNDGTATFENSALVTGVTHDGRNVSDASQQGDEVDPDQDSDAGNNNEATRITLRTDPLIGIAKELVSVSDAADGATTIEYTMVVANYGSVPLRDIQIREDLILAFPAPTQISIESLRSTDFVTNPEFNGISDHNLLAGVDRLNPGERGSVSVEITLSTHGGGSWFRNRAFASGHGLGDDVAFDLSQQGSDPDPDGDGDPTNNSDYTELFLAEITSGGYVETTMAFAADPFTMDVESIVLNAFLEINGFKTQLDARLTQTTFDLLTIGNNLKLGEIPLTSSLILNPTLLSFVSWQAGASIELAGVTFADTFFLTTPQSSSYNQFTASGTTGDFALKASAKFGTCPFEFWEASICADWAWPICSIPLSACLTFTDAVGFDALALSAAGVPVFSDVFSFDGTLDVSLDYSTDEKTLSPTLKVEPDWIVCPEISLLGEVVLTSGTLGIDGFSVYGITVEAPVGPVTFFLGDSFVDSKNSAATGKAEYFEVIGLKSAIDACCGTPGQFSLATYFERPPAPSGGLLGIGLIEGTFEYQFGTHFAVSALAQYRPVAPAWGFTLTMRVLW